ncbi:MAG: hypothetical protein JNM56_29820 [Planctomycetia bacterium]|nr:hypothetical protein [Planctomycetia bacterium]
MNRHLENGDAEFGLLANGSSTGWRVSVDESLDSVNHWSLEIDGPQFYLVVQLKDLASVAATLNFLRNPTPTAPPVTLGKFGFAWASLVWDDEPPNRCFVVIQTGKSALRLTLQPEDVEMLKEAFQQVVADLPEDLMKPNKESPPSKRAQ